MLNPFFQQGSSGEQNLVQDLINEQLRIYGIDVHFLPRKYLTENTVIKEVIESKFDDAYPIEAYIESFEGYGDNPTLLSKFGIQATNEITLIISKERFETYISPLMRNESNVKLSTRPKEGDLIYFPLGDRLFEIKYVEHEKPFYQLQKNYVYELRCELFRIEDEVIDTGIEEIDNELIGDDYDGTSESGTSTIIGVAQLLYVVGTGVTATANTSLVNNGVRFLRLTNRGAGYSSLPSVGIASVGIAGSVTGIGTVAQMISGINVCNTNTNAKLRSVQQIGLVNPGTGYTSPPTIKFSGGGGSGAAATSGISTTGGVGVVTVSSSGGGYINAPTVTFSTPKHAGAAATAVLATPMVGGGVSIMSAPISVGSSAFLFPGGTTGGAFYRTAPTVTFGLPEGSGITATATASINAFTLYGGNVTAVSIGNSGKFYGSAPTVTIEHPGFDRAAATIGLVGGAVTAYGTGSALDNSSVAISTGGKAYSSQPSISVGLGTGTVNPTTTAVGIATINSIGVVTGITFDPTEVWAVGQGATIGAGYTVTPTLTVALPSPVRATATATVSVAGSVTSIAIGNSGFGYNAIPTVTIAAPEGVSTEFQATGIATIRFNSLHYQGTVGIGSTTITGINTLGVIVGDRVRLGIGYSDSYNFIAENAFISGIGQSSLIMSTAATNVGIATSVFELGRDQCGIVTGILITYGGGGYLSPPTVSISNTVGDKNYIDYHDTLGIATATGISTLTSAGAVEKIYITDSGHGYVITPTITVEDPASDSTGTFKFNEIITGSSSGTTARVRIWNESTNQLEVMNVNGSFVQGETLTGAESGAQYVFRKSETFPPLTNFADNNSIETEADAILDFSEENPFGTP
jgi:hypothetical protein